MNIFFENPHFEPVGDGLNIRLIRDFHFLIDYLPYYVPEGFENDWASVPRIWWNIVPPHQYCKSAIMHDFLYSAEVFERIKCDIEFYEALREEGASWVRAQLMYRAVRIGGGFVWAKHDRKRVNALRECVGLEPLKK